MSAQYKLDFDVNKCKKKYGAMNDKARMLLKNEIVKDTDKFVPFRTGYLKNSAIRSISSKDDAIIYKGPYARFLYYGKVMIGVITHRPWAKKGEIKKATNRNLTFSHPFACARWFEKSKSINLRKWLDIAKKVYKNE